uniref:F-box domain-containing protein n=1 Tax=Cuerna arida TaxID=1464854 RepID=A0A1B6G7G9_9HEMI
MFDILPTELVEEILLYSSVKDIHSVFSAFNKKYSSLSDYFWKQVCLKEDFTQAYITQEWSECFQSGMNKKLGYYVHLQDVPAGILEHVYLRTLIIRDIIEWKNKYIIYYVTDDNKFITIKEITSNNGILFKDEFIIVQNDDNVSIYKYNCSSEVNNYEHYKTLPEKINDIFGICTQYCAAYNHNKKVFSLYKFCDGTTQTVPLPSDVKFLINKFFNPGKFAISFVSFNEGYRVRVFDISTCSWTLDLVCFSSTGITNDPNIWFGTNFIGCCDVSYRLRGIYFGPFKVWNNTGKLLLQIDIEPSQKNYLRCFFTEDNILLTTSDGVITIFDSDGNWTLQFYLGVTFSDIQLTSGHLFLVLTEGKETADIYDWSMCHNLYTIKLAKQRNKALCGDFLYCPINSENKTYEVIKFC